jgi:hypothetical protein
LEPACWERVKHPVTSKLTSRRERLTYVNSRGSQAWNKRWMGTIHRFPASQSLDPADLEIAASVYVEAIGRLCPREGDEACRERIAQSIIDRMLLGERDPIRLRDGALAPFRPGADGNLGSART